MRAALCLSLCLLGLAQWASSGALAGEIVHVEKGDPLRSVLLDTARPTFETETGGPVEFVVTTLNVMDGWAFGDVKLQRPGGTPLDWTTTKFAEDLAQGMLETEHNLFLLQSNGDTWTLVEYAVGPTDIAWDWWRQQRNLPAELFQP